MQLKPLTNHTIRFTNQRGDKSHQLNSASRHKVKRGTA